MTRWPGRRSHRFHDAQQLRYLAPGVKEHDLLGGTCFVDALTDDARLVMRVLGEARADGAVVLNGVRVQQLLREEGRVCGVQVEDCEGGASLQLRCGVLAVATGAWAERLRLPDAPRQLRPLRGSHLLLPGWRLPVAQAFTFLHERDRRPVFVFPWEGATVVGTTDLDHHERSGPEREHQRRRTRLSAGGLHPAVSPGRSGRCRRAVDLVRGAPGGGQRCG